MGIIREDFMLKNGTARRLYHTYAKDLPILDYHCHLSPRQIAEDVRFRDAAELFLGGDHYKWRQMRSNGVDERLITGDGDGYEKWCAFARTVPLLVGNPLYHWTALELKRYFDVDTPLTSRTAREIWDACNRRLASDEFSARALIRRSNVEVLCTTDDPADDLRYHKQLRREGFATRVLPTFRPDKLLQIDSPAFCDYLADVGVASYEQAVAWLTRRVDFFHENGCRLADHSLESVAFARGDAAAVFAKRLRGEELTASEIAAYKTELLLACAALYTKRGWVMQLHIGALRNNNSRRFAQLGADTGFDSMNDFCLAQDLSALLDTMERTDSLPKTIFYALNPKDNYVLGTMLGNFQRGPVAGKLQLGSGWWFNDNRDGMEAQLKALANLGVLGNFVGMLTDSRSFVSYPRHEYFRRIFCNLLGTWVEDGEYPDDEEALQQIVEGVCCRNAETYFAF